MARKLATYFGPAEALDLNFEREVAGLSVAVPEAVQHFFRQLCRHLDPAPGRDPELDKRVAEAVDSIDRLEQKRIAARELAESLSLSESRFLHLFKAELAVTLRKYLLWLRTREGAEFVLDGATVTEAAHQVGFTDSAHFSRAFKNTFGITLTTLMNLPGLKVVRQGR